jgi:hypothetical protein
MEKRLPGLDMVAEAAMSNSAMRSIVQRSCMRPSARYNCVATSMRQICILAVSGISPSGKDNRKKKSPPC